MKRSRFTEEQIIAILREQEAGVPVMDLCRKHGASSPTFYKWKARFGGMDVWEGRRLKALEEENTKLKRLLADAMRSLCESLSTFQGNREFHVTLTCEGEAEPLPLDLDSVTALGIVIAEIVSNAYIHAFPGRVGAIRVALTRSATGALLTIDNDGIGFVEPPTSKRHGLGLVRRLVEQIGGAVRVVSDQGTEWTLAFPMIAERAA